MKSTSFTLLSRLFAALLVVVPLATCRPSVERVLVTDAAGEAVIPAGRELALDAGHPGLLYGRVTLDDGESYEGRLRWGGDEEALWVHYFNGYQDKNRWVARMPRALVPKERLSFEIFGIQIQAWERPVDLGRPLMAPFGDIARIDTRGREVLVTLKSGTVFTIDRFSADDLADGVRVWDLERGIVDIGEWGVRSIEFSGNSELSSGPEALHGIVHTGSGDFTGLLQWNREESLTSDYLDGEASDGPVRLRFDAVGSIERRGRDGSVATLVDGSKVVLWGSREVGPGNRGVYVDDPRYGRVLVSWDAFERVDFRPGGTGPAYSDFPAGHPLTGRVLTRLGNRIAGRIVFDLDESESTETMDAPANGVDYTIPFRLIAAIVPAVPGETGARFARVTLRGGEELMLEPAGDLGDGNAGLLIFVDGRSTPEYVRWSDVERVDLDRPPS